MLLRQATGWDFVVERGPDWLFIRLIPPRGGDTGEQPLAEEIWETLSQHFMHRLVLELDDVTILRSWLIGQLVILHKRVTAASGMMRLAGLSSSNHEALRIARMADRFPQYPDRTAAVMGRRPQPSQPR